MSATLWRSTLGNEGARQPCTPTRVPTFMSGHLRCCSARPLQRPWRWPLPVEGAAGCGLEEDCVADAGQWTGCRKRMRDAGCGLRDADAGCRMQDADAGCGVPMRNAGCGMRPLQRARSRSCSSAAPAAASSATPASPLQKLLFGRSSGCCFSGRDVSSPGGRRDGWDSVFSDFVKTMKNKRKKQKGTKSD